MQNVMRTPNPNIARRDDSEGPHERNRGTPRCARIGRSPMKDETDNSLQDENRQDDLEQDGLPRITPVGQHLRFLDGPNSYEGSKPGLPGQPGQRRAHDTNPNTRASSPDTTGNPTIVLRW